MRERGEPLTNSHLGTVASNMRPSKVVRAVMLRIDSTTLAALEATHPGRCANLSRFLVCEATNRLCLRRELSDLLEAHAREAIALERGATAFPAPPANL